MEKVKVGLLLDSYTTTSWVYQVIERINSSSFATVSLIVKNEAKSVEKKQSIVTKVAENFDALSFIYYRKIENKLHKVEHNAFAMKNTAALLEGIPVINVMPRQTKFSDYIEGDDIAQIKAQAPDVFIRFGFRIIRGELLSVAKYGIWSYHHGDNAENRGMPAGAWEFLEKWHTTGSVLQILSDNLDGGKILYKSHSATNTAFLNENMNNYYWKSVSFVPRMLEKLYNDRCHFYQKYVLDNNTHPEFYSNRLFTTPTNSAILRTVARKGWNKIKNKIRSTFYFDQWALMYGFSKSTQPSFEIYKYKKMIPPKDRFWADPHIIFSKGKYYIFIEEVLYNNPKGHIAVIEMDEKGNYSAPTTVLDLPYHLSYPFIFEHEGQHYMMPETKDNKTIELYEAVDFPYTWKLKMNLMENVQAVDNTLLYHNNKWWLFANMQEVKGASTSDELFLFYADDLFTQDWKSHPQNPIVSDVRNARPAGRIFNYNGNLYRPAQICSVFYGWGISINHISVLTETEYKETTVNNIKPNWSKEVRQTHTLSHDNKLTVIDANMRRKRYMVG